MLLNHKPSDIKLTYRLSLTQLNLNNLKIKLPTMVPFCNTPNLSFFFFLGYCPSLSQQSNLCRDRVPLSHASLGRACACVLLFSHEVCNARLAWSVATPNSLSQQKFLPSLASHVATQNSQSQHETLTQG